MIKRPKYLEGYVETKTRVPPKEVDSVETSIFGGDTDESAALRKLYRVELYRVVRDWCNEEAPIEDVKFLLNEVYKRTKKRKQ